ncbi:MAG: DUF4214 domain-containing protein [Acidobacteria bacterium]|nr:DUF4214 domain-containing protein [Acidobacteriota bacterium]
MRAIRLMALVAALAVVAPAGQAAATTLDGRTGDAAQYRSGGGWVDALIVRAFNDVLSRRPDESEMRRYRVRIHEDHWNETDIREDLRERRDYWPHGERSTRDRASYDVDRVIRNAYEDVVGRAPSRDELSRYRRLMTDDGWTERRVRDELRTQGSGMSAAAADRIIRRAYQDLLGRAPDQNGQASFRNQIMHHGWDEHDVRESIMNSPEYRQRNNISVDDARAIVRRAYLSVLEREPDPASEGWVQRVLKDHWTERDVARELRNSAEYRSKQR